MPSLVNYPSLNGTDWVEDRYETAPAPDHDPATLKAAIEECDSKISNLTKILGQTRCRFNLSIESDRILECHSRETLFFLENHLRNLLSSTSDDLGFSYFAECDSIMDDITDQKIRLKRIRDRIKKKRLEFTQFCTANWKEVSGWYLQRDSWVLVLSVQQFEFH